MPKYICYYVFGISRDKFIKINSHFWNHSCMIHFLKNAKALWKEYYSTDIFDFKSLTFSVIQCIFSFPTHNQWVQFSKHLTLWTFKTNMYLALAFFFLAPFLSDDIWKYWQTKHNKITSRNFLMGLSKIFPCSFSLNP